MKYPISRVHKLIDPREIRFILFPRTDRGSKKRSNWWIGEINWEFRLRLLLSGNWHNNIIKRIEFKWTEFNPFTEINVPLEIFWNSSQENFLDSKMASIWVTHVTHSQKEIASSYLHTGNRYNIMAQPSTTLTIMGFLGKRWNRWFIIWSHVRNNLERERDKKRHNIQPKKWEITLYAVHNSS